MGSVVIDSQLLSGGAKAIAHLPAPMQSAIERSIPALASTRKQAASLRPEALIALPTDVNTYFGVVAGGGAPSYNEIALEKNVLYFARSLSYLDFDPIKATLFFANGNSGEATVRYLDNNDNEQFKAPEIPNLDGAATQGNTEAWFQALAQAEKQCPSFFYFTGHGAHNTENEDNNWLVLWQEAFVSVKDMAGWLDKLPADPDTPFVTMMAQCYSGSFANLIYVNGDPEQPVALQTRCGFFATVASRPSVGCTPAVNEADYKDYSSSFFAGLTGRDRINTPVSSADYNQDNRISYAEAHAFAKVDEETTDWPISTVEAWLQRPLLSSTKTGFLVQPIDRWQAIARPEQQYVIQSLTAKLNFTPSQSYLRNQLDKGAPEANTVEEAYRKRLEMELLNIAAEAQLRQTANAKQIAILDKLIKCEAGTWQ
ncbi:MAG: Caspase domain-containing protein [Leptolyngbya foveolarum]|uniref:Caspase domain-containing protein n=1 Tax=Leptolyngbya foveolarum TaxID=47253 RepID=A0A2W4VPD2_9CYAN|nr:MAG: Caspase domain-containing protein [Leptolyngbya foveolarum]